MFDFFVSLSFILLFFWVLLAIGLLIRFDSSGPALFRQTRVGLNGRNFICYKFRTMFVSAPEAATHEVPESEITWIGALLRRTKLDELPQLFNVLLGEMSLVGPRPCLPSQTELIEARRARGILDIRPGVTGLAQINQIDMSEPTLLAEWDLRYLQARSFSLDMNILVSTALGRGAGDKVRRT